MSQVISLIVGVVMPLIIDFVKRVVPDTKRWIQYLIAFVSCVIAGAVTTFAVEGIDFKDWNELLANIGLVFTASQTIYNLYWRDSMISKRVLGLLGSEKK